MDTFGSAVLSEAGETVGWEWPEAGLLMTVEDPSRPVFSREGTPAVVTLNADNFAAGLALSMGPDSTYGIMSGLFDEIDAHILAHGDAADAIRCLTEGSADPDGPIVSVVYVPPLEV